MERTISFRELVRLIHPDINPNITNAGGKMRDAKLFRGHPEELYKLAVRWGLMGIIGGSQTPQAPQAPRRPIHRTTERRWETTNEPPRPPRYMWRQFADEEPEVNGHVYVNTLGRIRVMVVRITSKRVYFYHNGRRTFASRKNVNVAREVRV